jgi:primosomal protein N' (replication factor Y)
VVVQTFNPEHPSISLAAAHDYASFVNIELGHRKAHHYPPYERLARLIVRSRDRDGAGAFADRLAAAFQAALPGLKNPDGSAAAVRLLGPAEAPVFRLKGYYRFHFQMQSPSPGALHQLLRLVLATVRPPAGVEYTIDIDPLNML